MFKGIYKAEWPTLDSQTKGWGGRGLRLLTLPRQVLDPKFFSLNLLTGNGFKGPGLEAQGNHRLKNPAGVTPLSSASALGPIL